jgi:hypothetical protein
MDINVITTLATGLGILGGVYAIVNRIEDRINKRMDLGFAAINTRFDDMRDLWRAELRRVEDVLDARLKHLEEK